MKKLFRLSFLLLMAGSLLAACSNNDQASKETEASGAEYEPATIRIAYNLPAGHHISEGVEEFVRKIEEKSDGQIDMQVFANGQLLTDKDMNQSLLTGGVEMGMNSSTIWASTVPSMGIFDVPYAFETYEEAGEALNGELGDILRSEMEDVGVKVLMFADYGFGQFANNKRPLESPEDFKGLKIRSVGALPSEFIQAYGASPVFMGGGEVYMGLQRKTVDGATSGTTAMVQRNYDEVTDYLTVNNYVYFEFILGVNKDFWDGLPEKTQQLIEDTASETEEWIRHQTKLEDERTLQELKDRGMEVYEVPEEDIPVWKEAAMPVWESFRNEAGAVGEELLDMVDGK
ncbi:TRAP transporter substrate-binding protein [Oceanobacillus sojae]|uniref:TRAP transporter substrate-binding protein n=1 Tax=Oceanobacillus sojae TaxID=582851 RepID=UPI000988613E|nr:DctP family TRAP transporter solute-binding subunit [Oceanobacillus sojae]MCT1903552.1 DctP family TRAP transporter solute-binding subunit [Oceanobacillus sojae]